METINIILDSDSEHKQCRLTSKYLKWEKIKLQPVFRKLLYIFPKDNKYKTSCSLNNELIIGPKSYFLLSNCIDEYAFAVSLAVSPHAHIVGLVRVDAYTVTILFVIFPWAGIVLNGACIAYVSSEAIQSIILIQAFPDTAVGLHSPANALF